MAKSLDLYRTLTILGRLADGEALVGSMDSATLARYVSRLRDLGLVQPSPPRHELASKRSAATAGQRLPRYELTQQGQGALKHLRKFHSFIAGDTAHAPHHAS